MNKILILLMILGSVGGVNAQAPLRTRITSIEIDGKEIKTTYRVFLLSKNKWIEAVKTSKGFAIPVKLRNEEHLSVLITFGNYKLAFSNIHFSNFNAKWVVGIDKKPFSEEFATPEEAKTIRRIYYIQFKGSGLETELVIKEKR